MGQRLNLEIVCDGEVLANAYYHWSAYSLPAAELAKLAIEKYYELKGTVVNNIELATKMLMHTGAGVNDSEAEAISNCRLRKLMNLHINHCVDRNHGLLSVTEDGINSTITFAEEFIHLDLYSETMTFAVCNYFDREAWPDGGEMADFDDFRRVDIDLDELPFDDIWSLIDLINEEFVGIRVGDYVVTWIA